MVLCSARELSETSDAYNYLNVVVNIHSVALQKINGHIRFRKINLFLCDQNQPIPTKFGQINLNNVF